MSSAMEDQIRATARQPVGNQSSQPLRPGIGIEQERVAGKVRAQPGMVVANDRAR